MKNNTKSSELYQQYTYLVRNSKNTDKPSESILTENITRNQIVSGFVTRCDKSSTYKYYTNYDVYTRHNSGYEHEVIFGWQPQRLKFDIDYKCSLDEKKNIDNVQNKSVIDLLFDDDDAKPTFIETAMDKILDSICDHLFYIYGLYVGREDLIVIDSSGVCDSATKYKYSYAIIIPQYLVSNNDEAREFTTKIVESLPADISAVIDKGVNKSVQNFRLANQAKLDKRVKKLSGGAFGTNKTAGVEDTVICPRNAHNELKILPEKRTPGTKKKSGTSSIMTDENVREILKLDCVAGLIAVKEGSIFKYRMYYDNLIVFDRLMPSHCQLCNEVHHKDNTLMLSVADSGAIFQVCRHKRDKTLLLGEYPLFREIYSQQKKVSESKSNAIESKNDSKVGQDEKKTSEKAGVWFPDLVRKIGLKEPNWKLDMNFPGAELVQYSEPNMRDYPLVRTLFVRAQMKLGKTKALRAYVDKYFSSDVINPVIRIVTFRQTFSNSIKTSFPNFALYNSMTGVITHNKAPRLIIQVESLHRLEMYAGIQPIQLLVLDEVESILEQFSSGLHKNFTASFAMFEWMVKTCEHLVCMDANLSSRTLDVLRMMRSHGDASVHHNTFLRAAGDTFHFTLSKGAIVSKMIEYVRAGKKIVCTTNSLADAKTIQHDFSARFGKTKQIQLYSSKTLPSEKKSHFSDVATYWSNLDVLIYTPTVSAGISFELEHFDALFGLFTDKSCSVEVCRQMLLRVRNLREHAYYIYLNGTFKNLPTDINDIKATILSSRRNLYLQSIELPVSFSYDAGGNICGLNTETAFFRLWLENTRVRNLSKNDFVRRFMQQVRDTGADVRILECDEASEGLREFKTAKKAMINLANTEIAQADNIGSEEAAEIVKQMSSDTEVDISRSKLLAYEKYKLRDTFKGANGLDITVDFVEKYNHKHVKNVYYNLQKIHNGGSDDNHKPFASIWDAVENIRQRELNHRDVIWSLYDNQTAMHKDVQYRYVVNRHRLAIMLLIACGFRCLTDKVIIYNKALFANLEAFQLVGYMSTLRNEFELSPSHSPEKVADRLKIVNSILRLMYGVEVKKYAKCNYMLQNTTTGNLFEIVTEESKSNSDKTKPIIVSRLKLNTTSEIDIVISVLYNHFYKDTDEND